MAYKITQRLAGATFVWDGAGKSRKTHVAAARSRLRVRAADIRSLIGRVDLPDDVNILGGTLELTAMDDAAGDNQRTAAVQRTGPRKPFRQIHWVNQPDVAAGSTPVSLTKSTKPGTVWSFPVDDDVLAAVASGERLTGWRITTTSAAGWAFYGPEAARPAHRPRLVLRVSNKPATPTDLRPSRGAVSVSHPVLGFTAPTDFDRLQVQVATDAAAFDPTTGFTGPLWDSGQVNATRPRYALAGTLFAGLADADDRDWSVRVGNDSGWSKWATPGRLARAIKGTLTVDSPIGATADGTPPVSWTLTGRTQVEYRAEITAGVDPGGRELWDSKWQVGADTAAYPQTGVTRNGQSGLATVAVRDTIEREATPGDPIETRASSAFTVDFGLAPSGVVAKVTTLFPAPWVEVRWMMASNPPSNPPDSWRILDDGVVIAVLGGADVTVEDGHYVWHDYAAAALTLHRYVVQGVVNGSVAGSSEVQEIVPRISGLWIVDPATGRDVVLWGKDELEGTYAQQLEELAPSGADAPVLVYGSSYALSGTLTGQVESVRGRDGATDLATLRDFKDNPAGPYRVAYTSTNVKASLRDVQPHTVRVGSHVDRIRGRASVGFQALHHTDPTSRAADRTDT